MLKIMLRVLGLQISPGAAVENALAIALIIAGIDKNTLNDGATGALS